MIRRMLIHACAAALLVAVGAFAWQAQTTMKGATTDGAGGTAGALASVLYGGGHDDD